MAVIGLLENSISISILYLPFCIIYLLHLKMGVEIAQFGLKYGQDSGSWAAKLYKELEGRVFLRSWSLH